MTLSPAPYVSRAFCGFFAFIFHVQAEVLIHTDFGDPESLRPIESAAPERISGVLPENVIEDSAWARIQVTYSRQEDALGGGLAWIEADLQGGERGQAQLKWPLPSLDQEGRYRLNTTLAATRNAAVTFAIRDTSPPYTVRWEHTLRPGAFREQTHLDFALPALEKDVALIAHMGQAGTLLFYNLTLIRRSEADLQAERERSLAEAPANLFPASGFPLGLPSGWSTGMRDSLVDDLEAASVETLNEGRRPLRLRTRHEKARLNLWSSPLRLASRDVPHVFSFYFKGVVTHGKVSVEVDNRELASALLPSSPDTWTRVQLRFSPDAVAPWHILHLSLQGDIEINRLMLSPGEELREFEAQYPVELALSGDPLKNHVLIEGVDSQVMEFAVTGAASGDVLHLKAFHIQGDVSDLPTIPLEGTALQQGLISLEAVFPDLPYGPVRIEGQVVRGDQTVSAPTERVIHRFRRPRFWGQRATRSRFGTHINLYEPHLYSSKAMGMNWVRLHGANGGLVYWSGVEPKPGEWQFHREALQRYLDAGLDIVGSWLHTPGWARIERQTHDGWLDNWWQPRDYGEFANYVKRVTHAHRDQIQHWQIWNEPWGDFWIKEWRPDLGARHQWHPGPTPEKDFAELSKIAYAAGKEILPEVTILGVNAAIGERGKNWMRKMLELDVEADSDVITYHAYTGESLRSLLGNRPEDLNALLEKRVFEPLRNKHGDLSGKQIWLTEGNALRSGPESGFWNHTLNGRTDDPVRLREISQALSVYHLVCFSKGTDKTFTYAQSATDSRYRVTDGIYWGALGLPGGELNPEASVFSTLAWHLEDTAFYRHLQLENGIHAFIFHTREGGSVAALIAAAPLSTPLKLNRYEGLLVENCYGNPLTDTELYFETLVWFRIQSGAEDMERFIRRDFQ